MKSFAILALALVCVTAAPLEKKKKHLSPRSLNKNTTTFRSGNSNEWEVPTSGCASDHDCQIRCMINEETASTSTSSGDSAEDTDEGTTTSSDSSASEAECSNAGCRCWECKASACVKKSADLAIYPEYDLADYGSTCEAKGMAAVATTVACAEAGIELRDRKVSLYTGSSQMPNVFRLISGKYFKYITNSWGPAYGYFKEDAAGAKANGCYVYNGNMANVPGDASTAGAAASTQTNYRSVCAQVASEGANTPGPQTAEGFKYQAIEYGSCTDYGLKRLSSGSECFEAITYGHQTMQTRDMGSLPSSSYYTGDQTDPPTKDCWLNGNANYGNFGVSNYLNSIDSKTQRYNFYYCKHPEGAQAKLAQKWTM